LELNYSNKIENLGSVRTLLGKWNKNKAEKDQTQHSIYVFYKANLQNRKTKSNRI